MKMKIVFATNNQHKLNEVKEILGNQFEIVSLKEIGCNDDIPETAETLEGNAEIKAKYIFNKYHLACFSDDTGLEIDSLQGRPGVISARYAGEPSNSQLNMIKVLSEMEGKINRNAGFRTVVCYISELGKTSFFEGKVKGRIAEIPSGEKGFGYDPIFIPDEHEKSFAELPLEEKNKISHRYLAVKKLSDYLHKK